MPARFYKLALCALVASVACGLAAAAVHAAGAPGVWSHPEVLWLEVKAAALLFTPVSLAVLIPVALFRSRPSTTLSVTVAVGWMTLIFVASEYRLWGSSGDFPWWEIRRQYLDMLPVPLSFGLAFSLCARALIGPN